MEGSYKSASTSSVHTIPVKCALTLFKIRTEYAPRCSRVARLFLIVRTNGVQ